MLKRVPLPGGGGAAVAPFAALLLSACAQPVMPTAPDAHVPDAHVPDAHVPDFARLPYQPFARDAAVAIALREWRLFGGSVRDEPPGTASITDDAMAERQEGLWQRVGEYWWLGQDAGTAAAAWTGKHDEHGNTFPPDEDERFAWSAAFLSYVLRIAGAGNRFPYAIAHATYIDAARRASLGETTRWAIRALPADAYAPAPGDLICAGRDAGAAIRFADLPAPSFPSHCDIVVAAEPGSLRVIGGNVASTVAMKHVPTAADGRLVDRNGEVVDARYPWFVVLQVLYDR